MGDLNISFCKDTTYDTTYTNIGQIIGTKVYNYTTTTNTTSAIKSYMGTNTYYWLRSAYPDGDLVSFITLQVMEKIMEEILFKV